MGVVVSDSDRKILVSWTRKASGEVRMARRAAVVLALADGLSLEDAAKSAGMHRHSAALWRDRYLQSGLKGLESAAQAFLGEVVRIAKARHLLQSDRLVVDGTLIKAWASMKSFKAKDGSDEDKPNFKGTKRSNQTHQSKTET